MTYKEQCYLIGLVCYIIVKNLNLKRCNESCYIENYSVYVNQSEINIQTIAFIEWNREKQGTVPIKIWDTMR